MTTIESTDALPAILLLLYPAIAVLNIQAISQMIFGIPRFGPYRHVAQSLSSPTRNLCASNGKSYRHAILLFDVTLMVMSYDIWRNMTLEKSRLAFASKNQLDPAGQYAALWHSRP